MLRYAMVCFANAKCNASAHSNAMLTYAIVWYGLVWFGMGVWYGVLCFALL